VVQNDCYKREKLRRRNAEVWLGSMGCLVNPIPLVIEVNYFSNLRPLNRSAKWIDRHRCWARENEVGLSEGEIIKRVTNPVK
jgi:hypothetical protein